MSMSGEQVEEVESPEETQETKALEQDPATDAPEAEGGEVEVELEEPSDEEKHQLALTGFTNRQEKKAREASKALETKQAELADVEAKIAAAHQPGPTSFEEPARMPQMEDEGIDYDPVKFQNAVEQYYAQRETNLEARILRGIEEKQAKKKVEDGQQAFVDRREAYSKANPRYLELADAAIGDLEPSAAVAAYLVESDIGPAMHHRLLMDRDVLTSLNAMSNQRAFKQLAEMEISMTQSDKSNGAKTTKALPDPIESSVGGGGSSRGDSSTDIYEAGITPEEYARREQNIWNEKHPS